ncbi:gem-associated protein 6 isoform X2 [Orussus abietinus]|uniref:gem-associated protein 6 isoform X2 n=1 Tax=Orussus abietinus TaxID=222816 RepID=UPI0006250298|nr:gem-associated protein 6 isoform X2 [Orussus abietinus]XP_012271837.1 gem-associated protein 6 isoform X2 [Orussus abietinus]
MPGVSEDSSKFSHRVFNNDPLEFQGYVNKKVIVTARDSSVHTGIVYTVDPVSESVVLVTSEENSELRLKVILGHAVETIEVSSEPGRIIPELFAAPTIKMSQPELAERKRAVKELLSNNRFPVEEENDVLRIKGVLSIEPPYVPASCICTNEIILRRIQSLLSQAPDSVS